MIENRASDAQVQATKQTDFAKSMIARLKEEAGSKILDFCEKATVTGAGDYTFYRFGEGDVAGNTLDMYSGGTDQVGNAGTAKSYVASIDYVYASDKIRAADVKSTSLDLKSSFVDSLVYAMKRNIDKKVLGTLDALQGGDDLGHDNPTKVYFMGDKTETLDSENIVNCLIEGAVFASTLAKETSVSGRPSVAIIVTAREHAILHKAERIINANYASVAAYQRNTLFGCEVIKVAESVKLGWATMSANSDAPTTAYTDSGCTIGQIYLIPQGTIGAASWEGDVDAKSWWDDGQDALFCRAKRSIGVVAIEPEAVIRVVYKR